MVNDCLRKMTERILFAWQCGMFLAPLTRIMVSRTVVTFMDIGWVPIMGLTIERMLFRMADYTMKAIILVLVHRSQIRTQRLSLTDTEQKNGPSHLEEPG